MTDIVVTNNSGFQINVAFRNFLFMRGQAIKDTRDVLTELVTNAVDAYRNIDGYQTLTKNIWIIFYYHSNPTTGKMEYYLSVTDNAVGVADSDMKDCFLSAGNLTASDTSRGFFSTGAKNITIMGDIYYTSIKDESIAQIYLDDLAYGHIVTSGPINPDTTVVPDVVGIPATPVLHQITGIPVAGLNCTLAYTNKAEIAKFSTLGSVNDMLNSIANIAVLRDIMTDPTYNIMMDIRSCAPFIDILNPSNYQAPVITTDYSSYNPSQPSDNFGGKYMKRLQYQYPDGDMILNVTFNVPAYPQYQAKFVVYQSTTPLKPQNAPDSMIRFGFLIKDNFAIYEANTLDDRYRWNPNIVYLYGYLSCDGFHQELLNYDAGISSDLIIDPNRVGGINRSHPLYVSIMSVALPRLDQIVLTVQNQATVKTINIDELDTLVSKLQDMGVNLCNNNNVTYKFSPSDSAHIALAIKGTQNSIVQEITGSSNLRILQEDSPTIEQIKLMEAQNTQNIAYAYYVDPASGDVDRMAIPSPDPTASQMQQNDQVMQSIVDGLTKQGIVTPTVYRFVDGNLEQLQIYQKGTIGRPNPDDTSSIHIQQKSFSIQFINDINHLQKYIIDTTSGITIKINLHNPVVADKLSKTQIDATSNSDFKISDEASYDALNFLETLISSALTDIVVGNDIAAGKVIAMASDNGVNTANAALDYWDSIEVKIEGVVHDLFTTFINNKKAQIQAGVTQNMTNAKLQIMNLVTNGNASLDEIEQEANALVASLQSSVMGIVASN